MMRKIIVLGFLIVSIITILFGEKLPDNISAFYRNIGLLKMIDNWPNCTNEKLICASYPTLPSSFDTAVITTTIPWFIHSLKWQPDSIRSKVHLAELLFAKGQRDEVLYLLEPLQRLPKGLSPLASYGSRQKRYESYLILALNMAHTGEWEEAVLNYRLGIAFGGDYILPVDEENYHLALARSYQEKFQSGTADVVNAYHIGKFYYEAGSLKEAVQWLNWVVAQPEDQLFEERPWAYFLLGKISEREGYISKALQYYQKSTQYSPRVHQALLEYLRLLRTAGNDVEAKQVQGDLIKIGPGYLIGRQAENYLQARPGVFPNGEVLVGYDLDPVVLENDRQIELWLWWQNMKSEPQESDKWVRVGDYWVERRTVTNLYPNAGFEWGSDESGIPLGQDRNLYNSSLGSLIISPALKNGTETNVLAAYNDENNPSIALASYKISTDPEKYYLMASWLWDTTRNANLGRNCWWNDTGGPYYIAYEEQIPLRPVQTWVHVADFSLLFPGQYPDQGCEVLLTHYLTQGKAMWDDILFTQIDLPR